MIWIVDASVALRWVLAEEEHPHAEAVLRQLVHAPEAFAVPELFCFEVFAVLNRLHPKPLEAFNEGIMPVIQGGVLRYPMTEQLTVSACEYTRLGLSGYDACYAALAQELHGFWLTFDAKAHRRIANRKLSHVLTQSLPATW